MMAAPLRVIFAVALTLSASVLAASDDPFRPAGKEELELQRVPFAPDASAAVLDWRMEQDDAKRYVTEYVRIKVLTDAGRKYASVEIPYDEKLTRIRDLRGRTIEPDGTIVAFDGNAFDKTIVKGRGVQLSSKTFTLPDVRVGSIVEYGYTHTWLSDTYVAPLWHVQREIPILQQHHVFRPMGPFQARYVTINLSASAVPKETDKHAFDFEYRNMPPCEDEPYALPVSTHAAFLGFFYAYQFHNTSDYWADAAGTLSSGFASFIGDSRFVREAVPAIVGDAKSDEEKLKKIYARVQQIENLWDEKKNADQLKREKKRENHSAEDVLRNGYGTGVDIDLLFVALARAAGFDADPVFLANHKLPFSKELPFFSQLSSIAVMATVDGADRYFDPAYSTLPFGTLHYDNGGVDGLRIRKKGGPLWIRTPISKPSVAVMRRVATLHFDGDSIVGTLHLDLSGYEAFHRRLEQQSGDESSRRKAMEDEVKGWLPAGGTAKLTKMSSWTAAEEPLTADLDVSLPRVVSTGGSHVLVPLSLLTIASKNPFTSEERRYDVHFSFAYSVEDTIDLNLPAGVSVSKLPEMSDIIEGPLSFHAASHAAGTTITLKRTFTIGTPRIPVAAYSRLRGFMTSVAAADAAPAVLEKSK